MIITIPPNAPLNERKELRSEDGKLLAVVEVMEEAQGRYSQVIVFYDPKELS